MIPEWLRALLGQAAAPGLDEAAPYLAAAFAAGYLLGAIPFGVVIARLMGLGDLRKIGSGNIGATNVLRAGGKGAAAATLALDAGKGAAAALLFAGWGPDAQVLAGAGAFVGHLFPVWLRFRGGKGVATFLGLILALDPLAGLGACAVWLAVAALTRISSAAGLAATASGPLWLWALGDLHAVLVAAVLAALSWLRHRDNIRRLARGEESRISLKRRR
ncbi:glycerol-3-phosphate 1-O-acyltransferase PlsY [Oceanicella actignis]|uniref:Glycerol-3-phosphate acyltransferase n=1 Tax=Oceanicella actignis TaxID=1189325 RepID=A0A1M7SC61_9RHOB|nr:glycerol-3-phosphate 1-O-acyltransferase PlsY [Oceanicella actignis]TYO91485.1 glycerol-3-phosphate acyltransferase PlsY [Oceanicella actignis]SET26441.1 glycerol-3-phosphate acyltransferase PlsY [Oceanicella actignis]SHN56093.1 glycerol-3-phosphate acyltransferase PlsY [Oceanicella actignis]